VERDAAGAATLPGPLRAGIESLSGVDMGAVRVTYDSPRPAEAGALAFARGSEIHLGPGQAEHLPHEAWHVVQQAQGRVPASDHVAGMPSNHDRTLEGEASRMGARAARAAPAAEARLHTAASRTGPAQFVRRPTREQLDDLDLHLAGMNAQLAEANRLKLETRRGADAQAREDAGQALEQLLGEINEAGTAAINMAVEMYELDAGAARTLTSSIGVSGPVIALLGADGTGSGAAGTTDRQANVRLGPGAFDNAAALASTLGHELLHARRHTGRNWTEERVASARQEVEAHQWELDNAAALGLSAEQIRATTDAVAMYQGRVDDAGCNCGCFLTTACVAERGLPDDCDELTTLRAFRDEYVARQPDGAALIRGYYAIAPGIVAAIHARADRTTVLDGIYAEIVRCVRLVKAGEMPEALERYRAAVLELEQRYAPSRPERAEGSSGSAAAGWEGETGEEAGDDAGDAGGDDGSDRPDDETSGPGAGSAPSAIEPHRWRDRTATAEAGARLPAVRRRARAGLCRAGGRP
jgi:hypothetical protein